MQDFDHQPYCFNFYYMVYVKVGEPCYCSTFLLYNVYKGWGAILLFYFPFYSAFKSWGASLLLYFLLYSVVKMVGELCYGMLVSLRGCDV